MRPELLKGNHRSLERGWPGVIAYAPGLIPVTAHRKNGKGIVASEPGCIFYATFIDDKGDGVFRI